MYPRAELGLLAARKAALRQRVQARRLETSAHASRVARPIEWLDGAVARWRRLSPLARLALVSAGLLLRRLAGPRARAERSGFRWAPLVLGAVRGVSALRNLQRRA